MSAILYVVSLEGINKFSARSCDRADMFGVSELGSDHEHPLVAPHVSHFSHVPFRTMVKFWHSEQELPV